MKYLTRPALITQLLLGSLLLTSCSSPSPFESLSAGECSDTQQAAVEKHITGQINALSAQDWPKAYTGRSMHYRPKIGLRHIPMQRNHFKTQSN